MSLHKTCSEHLIEARLVKAVRAAGGLCIKLIPCGLAGLPDRLVILPGGHVLFVEVKAPGAKPRPLQVKLHQQIAALGFTVLTIDNLSIIPEVLDQ